MTTPTTPLEAADAELFAIAKAAGLKLESWMTNPPKPAMWHGTPEALRAFARAILAAKETGLGEKRNG